MNITHVIPKASYERYFHTRYLYHEEAERGNKVNIITWNSQHKYRILSVNENLKVYSVPGLNIPILRNINNPFIPHLDSYIRTLNPDVIHAHILFKLTTLSSAIVSKELNVPLLVTIHGVIAARGFPLEVAQRIYYYTIGKTICKIASKIRCLTESDALEMIRFGCPPEKIVVIPNGVDTKKFKPEGEGLENVLYWGGRVVPEKGLEYLIKALRIIINRNSNVKLILAGDGPLLPKIFRLVNMNRISKNVLFKGAIPHENIPELLNSISILCDPSIREGMPFALLEAMSCSRPIVASNISGIKDVITNEENGILVPPGDALALANAIMRLMDDINLRQKLGKNARRLIVEKYDWGRIAEKMEKVYEKIGN